MSSTSSPTKGGWVPRVLVLRHRTEDITRGQSEPVFRSEVISPATPDSGPVRQGHRPLTGGGPGGGPGRGVGRTTGVER